MGFSRKRNIHTQKTQPPVLQPNGQKSSFFDAIKTGAGLGIGLEGVRQVGEMINNKINHQGDKKNSCDHEIFNLNKCFSENISFPDDEKIKRCSYFMEMVNVCQKNNS